LFHLTLYKSFLCIRILLIVKLLDVFVNNFFSETRGKFLLEKNPLSLSLSLSSSLPLSLSLSLSLSLPLSRFAENSWLWERRAWVQMFLTPNENVVNENRAVSRVNTSADDLRVVGRELHDSGSWRDLLLFSQTIHCSRETWGSRKATTHKLVSNQWKLNRRPSDAL